MNNLCEQCKQYRPIVRYDFRYCGPCKAKYLARQVKRLNNGRKEARK